MLFKDSDFGENIGEYNLSSKDKEDDENVCYVYSRTRRLNTYS